MISPTEKEEILFSLLLSFCNDDQQTLRIAGGWVRDKLLGLEPKDLDLTVSKGTGEEFAQLLCDRVHVIKKNPAKSKHLATACVNLYGFDIDITNLRSEVYTSKSNIPQVESAGPETDAFRRDCTINSMFYNLNTRILEDFTGRGLDDLRNGIIRTPMDPLNTFLDDPLRILRCIRFAARFGFALHEDILRSFSDSDLLSCFHQKITSERITQEVTKILTGPNELMAIHLLKGILFDHLDSALCAMISLHLQGDMKRLAYISVLFEKNLEQIRLTRSEKKTVYEMIEFKLGLPLSSCTLGLFLSKFTKKIAQAMSSILQLDISTFDYVWDIGPPFSPHDLLRMGFVKEKIGMALQLQKQLLILNPECARSEIELQLLQVINMKNNFSTSVQAP